MGVIISLKLRKSGFHCCRGMEKPMVDRSVCACDLMLFGAFGDLAQRKLFPALYQLDRAGLLAPDSRILAIARRDLDTAGMREALLARLIKQVPEAELMPKWPVALLTGWNTLSWISTIL